MYDISIHHKQYLILDEILTKMIKIAPIQWQSDAMPFPSQIFETSSFKKSILIPA